MTSSFTNRDNALLDKLAFAALSGGTPLDETLFERAQDALLKRPQDAVTVTIVSELIEAADALVGWRGVCAHLSNEESTLLNELAAAIDAAREHFTTVEEDVPVREAGRPEGPPDSSTSSSSVRRRGK